MAILSILAFLFIFSTIILIHEWGHFSSARRHGVHVEEFGLGVPPRAKTLWTDKKGCKFTLNWIPFGGFVQMEGEDAVDDKIRKTKGSFASKPLLARMEIILAGVFMNFVLAIILLTAVFSFGAKPLLLNQESVEKHVEQGFVVLGEGIPVTAVQEGGPAAQAGLQVGDVLQAIEGMKVDEAYMIADMQIANETQVFDVLRTNEEGEQSLVSLHVNINEEGKSLAAFSSMPQILEVKNVQLPVHKAFMYSITNSWEIAKATVDAFKKVVIKLVTQAQVPEGIAGPVGIASMTHNIVEAGHITELFKFMALLSLSLAIINVLPIPALDGGRFVFLLVEAVIRRPIKASWEANINFVSYVLLLALIAMVTWNDIMLLIFS